MSLVVAVILIVPVFPYAKRRPVGTPLTWGEAVGGATYIFFVLFWIYGVVPHQWLTWADSELNWRPDAIWFGPNGSMLTFFPINVSAQIFRDIVATLIYVVFLGGQMWMWSWWQNRGQRAEAAKALEPTSTYGRPLMKRA
jgi:hypothetical protein